MVAVIGRLRFLRFASKGRTAGAVPDSLPRIPWPWDFARAFSSEVETGSREENASKQKDRAPFRFNRNGKSSSRRGEGRPNAQSAREGQSAWADADSACRH